MQGYKSRLAMGVEASFGAAASFDSLVPFTSESISKMKEMVESGFLDGTVGVKQLYQSFENVQGAIAGEAVVDVIAGDDYGWDNVLYAALGGATFLSSQNIYSVQSALKSLTVGVNKYHGSTVKLWEAIGMKVKTLNIVGSASNEGGKVSWNAELQGKKLYRTGDAGITNSASDVTNLAPTSKPENIMMSNLTFQIGDQSNALAAGDQLGINGFEINIDNALTDPEYASITSSHSDGSLPIEPERGDRNRVNFSITMPRLSSLQFFDNFNGNGSLQAKLSFAQSGSKQFDIYLPYLKVMEDPAAPIEGAGIINHTVNFQAVWNTVNINPYMLISSTFGSLVGPIVIGHKSYRTAIPA